MASVQQLIRITVSSIIVFSLACGEVDRATECVRQSDCRPDFQVCRNGVCQTPTVVDDSDPDVSSDSVDTVSSVPSEDISIETDTVDTTGNTGDDTETTSSAITDTAAADTGFDTQSDADSDSDTDSDINTDSGTDTDTGSDTETGPEVIAPILLAETLTPVADTHVRTDYLIRADDNYGCEWAMPIARGRDLLLGEPGATQGYILFDIPKHIPSVDRALLELSIARLARDFPLARTTLGIYRILPSNGGRTPWVEGNGTETDIPPDGCAGVDDAYGVAWAFDAYDNNLGRPDVGAIEYAAYTIEIEDTLFAGDKVTWDITTLVNEWITGDPADNLGLAIIITDRGTSFHSVDFGTMDGETRTYYHNGSQLATVRGPRLHLTWKQQGAINF